MATIGADPELAIWRGNQPLMANQYFRNQVAYKFPFGNIGTDGCGRPAEIRPSPSAKPRDVVMNLGRLLAEAVKRIPDTSFLTVGSYVEGVGGIGGHLHSWGRSATRDRLDNPKYQSRICVGLSLLWALEDSEKGALRRHQGYGGINDLRGGSPSREFRSPSADWLASPSLAYHTLSFFQALVDRADAFAQDKEELNDILGASLLYWTNPTPPIEIYRANYLDRIIKLTQPAARSKDIAAIMFFADKLPRLREGTERLIRLDVEKWRRKAGCVD